MLPKSGETILDRHFKSIIIFNSLPKSSYLIYTFLGVFFFFFFPRDTFLVEKLVTDIAILNL